MGQIITGFFEEPILPPVLVDNDLIKDIELVYFPMPGVALDVGPNQGLANVGDGHNPDRYVAGPNGVEPAVRFESGQDQSISFTQKDPPPTGTYSIFSVAAWNSNSDSGRRDYFAVSHPTSAPAEAHLALTFDNRMGASKFGLLGSNFLADTVDRRIGEWVAVGASMRNAGGTKKILYINGQDVASNGTQITKVSTAITIGAGDPSPTNLTCSLDIAVVLTWRRYLEPFEQVWLRDHWREVVEASIVPGYYPTPAATTRQMIAVPR